MRKRLQAKKKGSITVFLALVGILIFALLGTLLETARYVACANHGKRTLRTATEALLTEYSRPLFERYGLFFIENSGESYESVIAEYVGDTLEARTLGSTDFLQGEINKIHVAEKTFVGDDNARALQREINQYMLHTLTKKQLKKWVRGSGSIGKTEQQADDIEETVEAEKEAAKLDKQVLKLMQLVDGISVSNGKVSCQKTFLKMFLIKEKKAVCFGITEPVVWKKMEPNIDATPCDFEAMNKKQFKNNVESVLELTKEAKKQADILRLGVKNSLGKKNKFAEHDMRMKKLVASLSVIEHNEKILKQTKTLLEQEMTEEIKKQLTELWKAYDTDSIVFDYTGVEEKGGGENPVDVLSKAFSKGMLSLVCEKPSELSEKETPDSDIHAKLYKESKKEKNYDNRVEDFTKKEEVNLSSGLSDMGGYGMDEFCLDSYIKECFAGFTKKTKGWKKTLDYQWEYIIAGKNSDVENLNAVLSRILLIRTVVNFAAIYQDAAKKSEAYGAAAAVVGFTGMEPLIRFTQTMILIAWSMVEGLVDIAALLQGRNVPVVKSPSQILTTFPQIFLITGESITKRAKKYSKSGNRSFGYEEYLMLFLSSTKQKTRRYRIMDLIQWDMVKNGYSTFQFSNCVFSMKVEGVFSFPTRFFRMGSIEEMLNRKMKEYRYPVTISVGYL